jgi:hypothetical protein
VPGALLCSAGAPAPVVVHLLDSPALSAHVCVSLHLAQLRGRVLGGCCGLTSSSYISLGSLYLEAGDLDQAEPLLR